VSLALFEDTYVDPQTGRFANGNLADYLLPVNADIAGSTCPNLYVLTALTLLVNEFTRVDTLLTYHRTWETGVGFGHEGRRIQPFIVLFHLSS
jgi:hypothetical protein